MKILLITDVFSAGGSNPWLLDDLATSLLNKGHQVDVLFMGSLAQMQAPPWHWQQLRKGLRIMPTEKKAAGGSRFAKGMGYVFRAVGMHLWGFSALRKSKYDLGIYTSIALFSWGLPGRLRRTGIVEKLSLVYWDFFPRYHIEIGRVRVTFLESTLKFLEYLCMKDADEIALMSQKNIDFLRKYQPAVKSKVKIIPPWSGDFSMVENQDQKIKTFTVVWGGQIILGRGLDTLLGAAKLLSLTDLEINFLVVGDGPELNKFVELSRDLSLTNVTFTGRLSRQEYRNLAQKATIGVAVTVPYLSVPTFSCKLAEFSGLGLPVVISIEESSDAADLYVKYSAGLKVPAGDPEALAAAFSEMYQSYVSNNMAMWKAGTLEIYNSELSSDSAATRLTSGLI